MIDYQAQEASLNAFNPNQQTVAYAVYFAGDKDLTLCGSKGTANGRMTRSYPYQMSVLYENKNGGWTEIARTSAPACSFCGDMVEREYYDGHGGNQILILGKPQWKSALICQPCKTAGRHHDTVAVDNIKYAKGL